MINIITIGYAIYDLKFNRIKLDKEEVKKPFVRSAKRRPSSSSKADEILKVLNGGS